MTNRRPSRSAIPPRRRVPPPMAEPQPVTEFPPTAALPAGRPPAAARWPRRLCRLVPLALLGLALALGACSSSQPKAPEPTPGAAPSGGAGASAASASAAVAPASPGVDESFSILLDENLYQLDEAMSLIARSLQKVADRTPTLAINSFYFGKEVGPDFRRKAEVMILDKLFQYNPNVRLVQCQECQKLETKISHGILTIRKGIPSQDARRALAQKLGVDGFIDIGMFRTDGQLTVYLKVIDAKTGAIILVDELAGRRAPRRRAITVDFGELTFPIQDSTGSSYNYQGLMLGVQEAVKLTGRFSFAVDLMAYKDNNKNSGKSLSLNTGFVLVPTLGFDILQVPSSTSRVIGFLGIGKLISPQLDYANLVRTGLDLVVGDQLSVTIAVNDFFQSSALDNGYTLKGAGYELRFGYRF